MPNRTIRLGRDAPLLDVTSFARRGPTGRVRLSPSQVEQMALTVARAPEVIVKVSRGATSTGGAVAHLRYIHRNGELEIETDEGERLKGRDVEKQIVANWDLDSTRAHGQGPYRGKAGPKPAKLVHKVILSMPKGTPPDKLLLASRRSERSLGRRVRLSVWRVTDSRTVLSGLVARPHRPCQDARRAQGKAPADRVDRGRQGTCTALLRRLEAPGAATVALISLLRLQTSIAAMLVPKMGAW